MIVSEQDLVIEIRELSIPRLHKWIRLGWVRPERREGAAFFHEVDVARVRLLNELEHTLEFDDDTLPLVLSPSDSLPRRSRSARPRRSRTRAARPRRS